MGSAKAQPETIVQITKNFKGIDVPLSKIKKLVKTVCGRFNTRKSTATVVSIAIVGDAEIREVNKRFLSSNRPTDVISFDLSDEKERKVFELIVSGEMAVKQAKQRGHSSEAELALYVTHGLLHNLGFDDSTQSKAKKMHDTENKILQQLGYDLVYNSYSLLVLSYGFMFSDYELIERKLKSGLCWLDDFGDLYSLRRYTVLLRQCHRFANILTH